VLTFDGISQRAVPEALLTKSVVKPDEAKYVVNLPPNAPALAGDIVRWGQFSGAAVSKNKEASDACTARFVTGRTLKTVGELRSATVGGAP
jgi:hypothetical protein